MQLERPGRGIHGGWHIVWDCLECVFPWSSQVMSFIPAFSPGSTRLTRLKRAHATRTLPLDANGGNWHCRFGIRCVNSDGTLDATSSMARLGATFLPSDRRTKSSSSESESIPSQLAFQVVHIVIRSVALAQSCSSQSISGVPHAWKAAQKAELAATHRRFASASSIMELRCQQCSLAQQCADLRNRWCIPELSFRLLIQTSSSCRSASLGSTVVKLVMLSANHSLGHEVTSISPDYQYVEENRVAKTWTLVCVWLETRRFGRPAVAQRNAIEPRTVWP